jgi:hypothetical protein
MDLKEEIANAYARSEQALAEQVNAVIPIYQVYVEIKPPKGNDPGQVVLGYYIIVDGVLTMTDAKGNVAQDDNGKVYSHRLVAGDDPHIIAGRLTRQLRDALRGKGAPPTGFSGPLDYPPSGVH